MELTGAACGVCANIVEASNIGLRKNAFTLVSSRRVLRITSQVSRSSGFQQNERHCIFGRSFRPCVASNTPALLSATHPEKSSLSFQGLAGCVQQLDLQRPLRGNLYEKRSIPLDGSATQQFGTALEITCIETNTVNGSRWKGIFGRVGVQAQQVGIRPIVQSRWMPVRHASRNNQSRLNDIDFWLDDCRLQCCTSLLPLHQLKCRI